MGEAKRRKEAMGESYGQSPRILPWLPITKAQSEQFMKITTQGAWIGIALMIVGWLTIRFIGPALGWWTLVE